MSKSFAAALVVAALPISASVSAEELTIERLVASPSLSGPSIRGLKMSPDGKRITFLRGKESNKNQLDLWEFDVASGASSLLVDSNVLLGGKEEVLSEEEKARRERARTGSSRGILSYYWSKDGKSLMFPLAGDVYVLPLDGDVKRLTNTPEYETDIKFSPNASYVSFIRNREVYAVNVETGVESQLTTGSTDTIANGMAEFIAQEELSRFTGYWWSGDETHVAFEQFDESAVTVKDRYEIQPDGSVISRKQRYPEAGSVNVKVKLGVVKLADKSTKWIDLGAEEDIYLARVGWSSPGANGGLGGSGSVAYQVFNRAQTKLDLHFASLDGKTNKKILTEESDVWVNINNDLRFLADGRFVWASERSGFKHLYLYGKDGKLQHQITGGDWVVAKVERIDEKAGIVYFTGHKDSPIERHLYSVSIDGGDIKRITDTKGWHYTKVGDGIFVDEYSNPEQPRQITIRSLEDGSVKSTILENKLDENHPYTPHLADAPKQTFGTIKAEDGTDLHYRMYTPKNMEAGKRYPVIMSPYGGPHGQSVKYQWRITFNDYLARNGYIVFVLDNRGMWNRGKAFEGHIKNAMGTVEVTDQVTGANYLKTLDFVDLDNIGIWGWSYGGYMTLMALFKEPDVFKVGVSGAPVTDWRLYDTGYTERYLGHPDAPGDVYENSSVFKYVDGFKGDLLLIHGMADDNVFFDNSVKLMATLQSKGKHFELMTYPGQKHGFQGEEVRAHLYNQIIDFFDRKLK